MLLEVETKGRAHRVAVFEVGPSIWSVECQACPVRRRPGEPGPPWFVETAFNEEHLDRILDAHLGSGPSPGELWRRMLEEER